MTRERALQIANEFLHYMNPDMWNGKGFSPASFNEGIYEPEDNLGGLHLEITFGELDEGEEDTCWYTYVDLVDGGTTVEYLSCYGVDSPQNIADCIMDVCKWNGV